MSEIDPRAYRIESASRLIAYSNQGEDEARVNEEYRKVLRSLHRQVEELGPKAVAKATLRIDVDFTLVGAHGRVEWRIAPVARIPAPPRGSPELAFLSDDLDGITLQDPAQDSLFPHANLGRRRALPAEDAAQ